MPGFPDLPRNIILFSEALRESGVMVTTDSILASLKGLRYIDIKSRMDFYYILRGSLVSRWEDVKPFDDLFERFWSLKHPEASGVPGKEEKKYPEGPEEIEENQATRPYEQEGVRFRNRTAGTEERAKVDKKEVWDYSPDEILRVKDFSSLQADEVEQLKEWVVSLSRRMAVLLSRRWKKGKGQGLLDFRRTIRRSLKYGGEIVELQWKRRKPRPLEIVFLCDVSGSMDIYCEFLLLFMHSLQNFYPDCETLAFGTRLTRITHILKRKRDFNDVLQFLSRELLDWSGGTNIGGALHELRRRHSTLLHPRRTIFLLFSDGWERGDTALLDSEMRRLRRLTRKMIWLNPHLANPHYKPLCKGMATALPYLDYFLPCHDLSSLRQLADLVPRI